MKNERRTFSQLYYENGATAATLLIHCCPNAISNLLLKLQRGLGLTEQIDIHQWTGELYYIVVRDNRDIYEYPGQSRCGFTVNIATDEIFWNLQRSKIPFSGNCFVRTAKWKRFLKTNYGGDDLKDRVHWYDNYYGKVRSTATV
jgi:hypothetical protein